MKILHTLLFTGFLMNTPLAFSHENEDGKKDAMMDMKDMDHEKMKVMMKQCMSDNHMKEMDHNNMTDQDREQMKAMMKQCMSKNGMKDMDHDGMKGMDHGGMKGMDHDGMKSMDHESMKGMDHEGIKGMDHDESASGEHGHDGGGHANSAGTRLPATDFVDSTIHVTLLDTMEIKYAEHLDIGPGDVVKFIVTNKGKLRHEFSISNAEEQIAHVQMMRKMPNMKHDDVTTLSLGSGEIGEMVWKFDGDGDVVFSCNIPGHSEAGMLTKVIVSGDGEHGH